MIKRVPTASISFYFIFTQILYLARLLLVRTHALNTQRHIFEIYKLFSYYDILIIINKVIYTFVDIQDLCHLFKYCQSKLIELHSKYLKMMMMMMLILSFFLSLDLKKLLTKAKNISSKIRPPLTKKKKNVNNFWNQFINLLLVLF